MNFGTFIGRAPPNVTGQPQRLRFPVKQTPAEGWDLLTERLWVPYSPFFTKGAARTDHEGQGAFFVQDETVVEYYAGLPVIELVSRGIADVNNKPYKSAFHGATLVDADSNYSSTWWKPDHARVEIWGVSLTQPSVFLPSTPLVPPVTYGLPETPWSRVNVAVITVDGTPEWRGQGWLLEDRQIDTLPGGGAHLYHDTYAYDFLLMDPTVDGGSRDEL